MEKKPTRFEEQQAPIKNTDNAFVKVSKDGSPVIPDVSKDKSKKVRNRDGSPTTLDKR